jgi:hypothetical protein
MSKKLLGNANVGGPCAIQVVEVYSLNHIRVTCQYERERERERNTVVLVSS